MMALLQNAPAAIGFDELYDLAQGRLWCAPCCPAVDDRKALASGMLCAIRFAAGVVWVHSIRRCPSSSSEPRGAAFGECGRHTAGWQRVAVTQPASRIDLAIDGWEARRLLPMSALATA